MTDYTSLVLGADASHYQGHLDFGKLIEDAVQYVILKATQGMHVDPDFEWNRNEAERRGMLHLAYPYIMSTDNISVIKNTLKVIDGDVLALDWEAPGVSAERVEVWMDAYQGASGRAGLAYYGKWPPAPVTQQIETWPRWLPNYAARPNTPMWNGTSAVTDWSAEWLIWQYTGNGRLVGVSTAIDLNRLACPLAVFKTWVETGKLPMTEPAKLPLIPSGQVIQLHSSGDAVLAAQRRLAALGYHIAADSEDGAQTTAAIEAFQIKENITPADGVIDGTDPADPTLLALNAA